MSHLIKHFRYFFFLSGLVLFSFCNSADKTDDTTDVHDTSTDNVIDKEQISAQNIFNSIPARAEIMRLIGDSKLEYDPAYLNNPDLSAKYSLENSRALNLGVYGADLSVSGAFDQTQESMLFLKCVNVLAKNLGVSTAFDQRMMDRMDAYKENRDSTLEIIAGAFRKADEVLKENNRPGTSALILAGAWVEGIYISCKIAQNPSSLNVIKTILTQQESLGHLISMMKASNISTDAKYVFDELEALKLSFDAANKNGVNNLEGIKDICDKIFSLRKKVVETF